MARSDKRAAGALLMELPSRRKLVYRNARVENGRIIYWGVNQYTRQWCELDTYGGKLVENATQAVARDLLAEAMVHLDRLGVHAFDDCSRRDRRDGRERRRACSFSRAMKARDERRAVRSSGAAGYKMPLFVRGARDRAENGTAKTTWSQRAIDAHSWKAILEGLEDRTALEAIGEIDRRSDRRDRRAQTLGDLLVVRRAKIDPGRAANELLVERPAQRDQRDPPTRERAARMPDVRFSSTTRSSSTI